MYNKSNGYTLVELIVAIAILGIILAIAVAKLAGFKSKAEDSVCAANRKTVERMYSFFLVENSIDHADSIFNQFFNDNYELECPSGGMIRYEVDKVKCSVHKDKNEDDEKESPRDEVPWL